MMKFEQEAEQLFCKMRESSEHENHKINEHLYEISKPTGYNLFDMIDELGGE